MTKTLYYMVFNDGELSRPYSNMESIQVEISSLGAPHHINEILVITYKMQAGLIDKIERQSTCEVWWKKWNALENAKRIIKGKLP